MEETDHDVQLMLRLQAGEDLALNELMARWQRPVVSFILRHVGNEADAIDLAQETFVRIYESRDRFKPSGRFSAWLFTIAANLCRNHARWVRRHPTVTIHDTGKEEEGGGLEETLRDGGLMPSESVTKDELAEAVRREVGALPEDLKTAVLLFEFQELSHQEIAVVQGCSAKAVETRLYRARRILREKLARWLPE